MEQLNPAEAIGQMASGLWLSRALWGACRLKVADQIDDEPVEVETLAEATGAHAAHLKRLLNALSAFGVFAREGEDRFGHNALSRVLRSDDPHSQRAFVDSVFGGEHYEAWSDFEETLRTGQTSFEIRFGMPVFDYYSRHPDTAKLFGEAMTASTRRIEQEVLNVYKAAPFELAVDVGGSQGSLLRGILAQHANARGIVFDLEGAAEAGRAFWSATPEGNRMEAVAGDFFGSVPEGGDLYLLKFILHDWTDAQCATILKNIRRAIRRDGRIAVFEMVLPEEPAPHPAWLLDLNMMAMTGGRERTIAEYDELFETAGFRRDKVTPTASPVTVVEAVPV